MILHDTIKTIKNKVFPFSLNEEEKEQNLKELKRTKSCFFLKNPKKRFLLKKTKKTGGLGFFEKTRIFLNPDQCSCYFVNVCNLLRW